MLDCSQHACDQITTHLSGVRCLLLDPEGNARWNVNDVATLQDGCDGPIVCGEARVFRKDYAAG
jgi:hypothetical protein